MVCLGRPYPINVFKGCLPQVLLGQFLNTLSQINELHYILQGFSAGDDILLNSLESFEKVFAKFTKYQ